MVSVMFEEEEEIEEEEEEASELEHPGMAAHANTHAPGIALTLSLGTFAGAEPSVRSIVRLGL